GETIKERVQTAQDYITASLKSVKGAAQGESILSQQDLVPCSIEKCVRKVIQDYPFKENEREKLHFTCLKDFTFLGNEIFMVRVIENIIKNAYEQIDAKGKGEIYIQCNNHDDHSQLIIKDTAGDVTHEVVDALFQGMNTTKADGTGIGLSSAKEVMQMFGGEIKAQLIEGDCIAFILSFPPSPSQF
ncbi:MAG TPA: HAMP domain-containing sensor histidine kinase, partial [Coxiellaceae bacterium]|nr:HAMP domain-containing sensor histidine kinase [Coxiellaceae bacterium]